MNTPTRPGWWLRVSAGPDIRQTVETVFEHDGGLCFYDLHGVCEAVDDYNWLGQLALMTAKPEPDGLPFEVTRLGITWGTTREISDDQVMAMFVVDGDTAPRVWAGQDLPTVGDVVKAEAIGLEGECFGVAGRMWHASNFVAIVCTREEVE